MSTDTPLRRLIKMHGVSDLENDLVLEIRSGNKNPEGFQAKCDEVLFKIFGIRKGDTVYHPPSSYFDGSMSEDDRFFEDDKFEENEDEYDTDDMEWAEDRVEYLKRFGWDLTDDRNSPLQITKYVSRVVEAVAKGLAGSVPEANVIDATEWAEQLQKQADIFRRNKKNAG
jgi:hypothetical protein